MMRYGYSTPAHRVSGRLLTSQILSLNIPSRWVLFSEALSRMRHMHGQYLKSTNQGITHSLMPSFKFYQDISRLPYRSYIPRSCSILRAASTLIKTRCYVVRRNPVRVLALLLPKVKRGITRHFLWLTSPDTAPVLV